MSQIVTVAAHPQNPVAAIFNLDDTNERRVFDTIQAFYDLDGRDRLHALRRGIVRSSAGPLRMVWTLGSFCPDRRGAATEWTVAYWQIDAITVQFQRCKDEPTARAVYESDACPRADLPGVRMTLAAQAQK